MRFGAQAKVRQHPVDARSDLGVAQAVDPAKVPRLPRTDRNNSTAVS